jgi:tungstate transport system substrate-binding protein
MRTLLLLACAFLAACGGEEETRHIRLASTTSTQNSGLFDHILPRFTEKTGIDVHVVAVGTGQAIRLARSGDADVLLVHHKPSEEKFVADGFGVERHDLMYNDFVVLGPEQDPAGVRDAKDAVDALKRIATADAAFVSRGDDSGTNKKELELWKEAGIDVASASGSWYRESGSGMGATLNIASGMNAYTISDRATWLSFSNKGELAILHEGDERLFNLYGVIAVSREKHPGVDAEGAAAFVDWITSKEGQEAIASFRIDGLQVFFPNAAG